MLSQIQKHNKIVRRHAWKQPLNHIRAVKVKEIEVAIVQVMDHRHLVVAVEAAEAAEAAVAVVNKAAVPLVEAAMVRVVRARKSPPAPRARKSKAELSPV